MKQHIVHMSTVHPANDTRIFLKECTSLAEAGYEVTLIARPPKVPIESGDVRIVEFTVGGNRAIRMVWGSVQMLAKANSMQADVYHFHDPELIPVGLVLKLLRKRVIYDVHEDLPAQVMSKPWIPKPLRKAAKAMVTVAHRIAGAAFDRIVVAREDAGRAFTGPKSVLVQNYPLLAEFDNPEPTSTFVTGPKHHVAYVGGISEIRGIHEMISAVELVSEKHDIQLELAGPFQPGSLEVKCSESSGWQNVNYHGWVDRSQMSDILGKSMAGLLLFHPVPNHLTSYPNKLFEYMSAGLPVIASNFDYWKQFISEPNSGILVDPTDPNDVASAITHLIENPDEAREMGARGKEAVRLHYNWEKEAEKLLGAYQSILAPKHSDTGSRK